MSRFRDLLPGSLKKTASPPVLWMAAIFATSCTVVSIPQFLGILALLLSRPVQMAFAAFYIQHGIWLVKGWHATEYAILFLLLHRFARFGSALSSGRHTAALAAFCVLFAASDEGHQSFVPNRIGSIRDVLIDAAGVAAGVLIAQGFPWLEENVWRRWRKQQPHPGSC